MIYFQVLPARYMPDAYRQPCSDTSFSSDTQYAVGGSSDYYMLPSGRDGMEGVVCLSCLGLFLEKVGVSGQCHVGTAPSCPITTSTGVRLPGPNGPRRSEHEGPI